MRRFPLEGKPSVEVGSVSEHPGSPQYDDQLALWARSDDHYLPLDGDAEADMTTFRR